MILAALTLNVLTPSSAQSHDQPACFSTKSRLSQTHVMGRRQKWLDFPKSNDADPGARSLARDTHGLVFRAAPAGFDQLT